MLKGIDFHCNTDENFRSPGECVRCFTYYNYSISLHTHSFYEINIVVSGSGMHQINNRAIDVQKGNVFIIPPNIPHGYYDTKELDVIHILIRPEIIKSNINEAEKAEGFLLFTEIEPTLRTTYTVPHFLTLTPKQMRLIEADLDLIKDDDRGDNTESTPLVVHTLWKLIYMFSYYLSRQISGKNDAECKYEKQIIEALEYIHKNYGERITIDNLCSMLYISRSTFLRSFSMLCGVTPHKYINRYRAEKAIEMLEENKLTKVEIAQRCGYYDLSHLAKAIISIKEK